MLQQWGWPRNVIAINIDPIEIAIWKHSHLETGSMLLRNLARASEPRRLPKRMKTTPS
jgi:hypothetical protein